MVFVLGNCYALGMTAAPRYSGFTLIEVLTAAASLMIFFVALSTMIDQSLRIMGGTRAEAIGATLGQSQVELANNLEYEDLGTVGGIPPGSLEPEIVKEINGQEYTLKTNVVFVDDPFDDIAPLDLVPVDYKRVRVEVSWKGIFAPKKPLVFWNDVAPKGIEQLENAGTIMMEVFDADGLPVVGAQVQVVADAVTPSVNLNTSTDIDGRVLLPGAAICVECYKVTVTKPGFTTDRTYGDEEVTNPHMPHLSVLEGQLTQTSFTIDEVSSLTIRTTKGSTWGYQAYGNIQVELKGTKEIGRNEFDEPVFKVDQTVTTGSNGQVTISNMEWDTYDLKLPTGGLLQMAGRWELPPIALKPGSNKTFTGVIVNESPRSLVVAVVNAEEQPVEGASVRLTHPSLSYDVTYETAALNLPDQGQAYFGNLALSPEAFQIMVNLAGYQSASSSATVSGDLVEKVILNPIVP